MNQRLAFTDASKRIALKALYVVYTDGYLTKEGLLEELETRYGVSKFVEICNLGLDISTLEGYIELLK